MGHDPAEAGNSLYTRHLVQELSKPGSRIEGVFKRVRLQVRQRTQARQVPWETTSLEEEFYFDQGFVAANPLDDRYARDRQFSAEKAEWDRIRNSKDVKERRSSPNRTRLHRRSVVSLPRGPFRPVFHAASGSGDDLDDHFRQEEGWNDKVHGNRRVQSGSALLRR